MASIFLLLLVLLPAVLLIVSLFFLVRPRPVKIPIKGRHVFVTGGSSGIGLALAKLAAREGARVSILARSMDKLEEARDLIRRETGVEVRVLGCDVRDFAAVRAAVEEAGEIDALICSHGVYVPKEMEVQSMEEIKFMVDVNLMGTFHVIKAALPGMRLGGGSPRSISLLSSQAGQVGIYGYTAYSASKFALRGLGEALQQEIINHNIHVSLVFPPDTETPGFFQEIKDRPEITNKIAGASVGMKADDVAVKALRGIKTGNFTVACNFDGLMLSIATCGMSPQRSWFLAFCDVIFVGPLRFLALWYQQGWYDTIDSCRSSRK